MASDADKQLWFKHILAGWAIMLVALLGVDWRLALFVAGASILANGVYCFRNT